MTRAVLSAAVLAFFLTSELFDATLSASNFNEKTVMDRGETLSRRVKRYGEHGHITNDTTNHDPFKESNKESRQRQEQSQHKWEQLDKKGSGTGGGIQKRRKFYSERVYNNETPAYVVPLAIFGILVPIPVLVGQE